MTRNIRVFACGVILLAGSSALNAQVYDIDDFDESAEGPWSDIDATTWTVPMVPDGSITVDGILGGNEYGGFEPVLVTPGSADGSMGNAWILGFAQNKNWEGMDDSSFTFSLAHDTNFLYVGVEAKDDAVISDNSNPEFWKDDAIEIVVDANNDRVRNNTDNSGNLYGGHNYVNYEGRFSRWDEDLGEQIFGVWATDVDWTYGDSEDDDITGVGGQTEGGWNMEVRFHKRQFEDPDGAGPIEVGDRMGFNIGMDDDDEAGDLEIQYWAANRAHPYEFDQFALEDGETQADYPPEEYDWIIDAGGRLSHGGTGEIIWGGPSGPPDHDAILSEITDPQERLDYVHNVMETWMGDSNFDSEFSSADFVKVFTAGEYEDNIAGNSVWSTGDWNGDSEFTSSDFVIAFTDGGYELGPWPKGQVQAVPEPVSFTLLALAFIGLLAVRRK